MSASPALAGRLLFTGARHPRAAMREAMAAGPGEAWRLGTLVVSTVPLLLVSKPVLNVIAERYAVAAGRAPDAHHLAGAMSAGLLFLILFLVFAGAIVIAYIALAITISAAFALTSWAHPSFAGVRSLVAVASWIGLIPAVAAMAACGALWPNAVADTRWRDVSGLLPSVVYVPYFALCMIEAFEVPAARSVAVSAVANIGLNLPVGFLTAAPTLLTS